jgi:toxin ParE1/3/4
MVKWSASSKNDLKNIYDYIAFDSLLYAKKLIISIVKKAQILNKFPEIGKMVPELMDESIREIIITPYRVIYCVSKYSNDVEVLSIIHGKRDFDKAFVNIE